MTEGQSIDTIEQPDNGRIDLTDRKLQLLSTNLGCFGKCKAVSWLWILNLR
jgi:hypothetical protein